MSWFKRNAHEALQASKDILEERGTEYADSWADAQTPFLELTIREIPCPKSKDERRIYTLASLCDVKLSRIRNGSFKSDNHIDFNNYNSVFCTALNEYMQAKEYANEAKVIEPARKAA